MKISCTYAEVHQDSCGFYLEYKAMIEKENGEIEELYLPHVDLDMRSFYEETTTQKINGKGGEPLDTLKTSCFIIDFMVNPPYEFKARKELVSD